MGYKKKKKTRTFVLLGGRDVVEGDVEVAARALVLPHHLVRERGDLHQTLMNAPYRVQRRLVAICVSCVCVVCVSCDECALDD
jgi:hypothetical protein